MPFGPSYQPAPSFPSLGREFFDPVQAASFPRHAARYQNQRAAASVGLDQLSDDEWEQHFARLQALPRNLTEPLALRYHGHQFQSYNPWLGDGRGFLHAQLLDKPGRLLDLGTKGSGTTPYSRGGDGRLTLKGAVREVLATEMLEALGVYTSKSFSVFETGERLQRNDEPSPTRAAVLVRLSHSHIRFGSFQRHAHSRRNDLLNQLLEFVHHNYLPEVSLDGHDDLAGAVLDEVVSRSARLTATWMMAGFVHGVLNTDNMNITGESFDYGPWRFLPTLDPSFTSAYFDFGGLYAYGRQPDAVQWNLYRLADALLPISSESSLRRSLDRFDEHLAVATREQFLERMGLSPRDPERDGQLLETALTFLRDSQIPFERIFFDWHGGSDRAKQALSSKSARFYKGDGFSLFSAALSDFEASSSANLKHPYFQDDDPCTMLIDEMEAAWEPIAKEDDWTALDTKLSDIRRMGEALALRPRPL
jgi:serine/tyrosine/threonine adenylyltransferase